MLSKNKVKFIQSLCQKKQRQENRLFIAEGTKIVEDILRLQPSRIETIYALPHWADANEKLIKQVAVEIIDEIDLKKISNLNTPNEVVAIVQMPENVVLPNPHKEWIVILQDIQDPGNLGTIIRIADWFGLKNIVCSPQTVDIYNPKVIQATMGSFLNVYVHYTDLTAYVEANDTANIMAAVLDGADVRKVQTSEVGILIIGNEGKGVDPSLLQYAQTKISILGKGNAESLNASVATGILLSHLVP